MSTRRRDHEVETPELAVAGDVGDRLAGDAARDERLRTPASNPVGRGKADAGEELRAIPAEHVTRQHLGVAARRRPA